jgi:hypothetical protein
MTHITRNADGSINLDDLYWRLEQSGQAWVPSSTVSSLRRRAQRNGLRLATHRPTGHGTSGDTEVWLTTDGVHIWTRPEDPDATALHNLLVWHQYLQTAGNCTCGHAYRLGELIQEHVVQIILDAGFSRSGT